MENSNSCFHQFDPFYIKTNNKDFMMPVPVPVPGFSTYDLLKNCGYLIRNTTSDPSPKNKFIPETNEQLISNNLDTKNRHTASPSSAASAAAAACVNLVSTSFFTPSNLLPYSHSIRFLNDEQIGYRFATTTTTTNNILLSSSSSSQTKLNQIKKQRSEKRPIPDEQKDKKYFERRRRNNQAAKKSRDARKLREDQIAMKASILEQENAILRAQVLTLRDEASTLRQMLLESKSSYNFIRTDTDLCTNTTRIKHSVDSVINNEKKFI